VVDWISTWRHKQGHLLDISISAELVDVHGERCILAYIADITERSKAEKALHDSETLLRTVVDEIPEPVVLKDENANFVLCNKSVADLYNTTPDAMIGKHDGDFGVPAEMAEFFRDNVLRIMATGQAETVIEDSRNATTGEIRHYKSIKKPFQVADGKNRILIIAHDITDIVRSQALIAENEKRLQEVMNVTLEGVWDWHVPSGRVVHNAQWYRSLGLTPGEFPGTMAAFSELVHRNDQEAVREKLDAMLGGVQDSYSSVHRLRHSDGWYLWVKDRGRIVERDATGAPLRIIGSFSDITESVRTQDELEAHRNHLEDIVNARTAELAAARDAAEEASRAKSLFLANMSHELRTPMNAIMGMTNLALRLAEDPQQNDWLTKSLDASQHLLDVINDILDVSRIEANRVVLEARNFDPAHVIGEALAMQTTAALGKGLRLVPEIDPALPQMVCGDAMRLRQIVINFLGNAIKFSDTGVITARIRPVKWEGNIVQLRIEIADQGIGISAEQQMRLFQAFSQADSSMSRRYGGTGLGLVISKRIANLMGGNVGVISAEGQGSTFWAEVSLKLANVERDVPNQVTAESARELLERTYAGLRVLIAEDEMLNQEVTACLLQEAGLIPEVASNGKEALAMAAATDYAVILMDVQMPVMNGLEATRAIRELPGRATTPILAMTANAFDEDREKCLAAGMNAHLGKPYRPETLFAALLKYLRESGAPRAS
jgi:PAS domain S-box-containing protein